MYMYVYDVYQSLLLPIISTTFTFVAAWATVWWKNWWTIQSLISKRDVSRRHLISPTYWLVTNGDNTWFYMSRLVITGDTWIMKLDVVWMHEFLLYIYHKFWLTFANSQVSVATHHVKFIYKVYCCGWLILQFTLTKSARSDVLDVANFWQFFVHSCLYHPRMSNNYFKLWSIFVVAALLHFTIFAYWHKYM